MKRRFIFLIVVHVVLLGFYPAALAAGATRFGVKRSLFLARVLHGLSWGLLILAGIVFNMGPAYWAGMAVAGGLFIYEHGLVRHDDLGRLDMAFFNMNGYISMAVFVFTLLDYMVAHLVF